MTLCVASQRVFVVVVYFVIDRVRKLKCSSYFFYTYYSFVQLAVFQCCFAYILTAPLLSNYQL
jgi:hypothetical protein